MESLVAKHFPPSGIGKAEGDLGSSRLRTAAAAVVVAVLVTSLIGLAHYASGQLSSTAAVADEEAPVYLPDVRFLRLASLGYDNALADVLWFRTIDYFGRHFRGNRLYPWLARMCDVVTDLDPRAQHVYQFGGFVLPWEAQMPDDGIRLLRKGVEQFPDSWELQYFLGFNLYYFKQDLEAALPHLRRASELPGVHPYVTHLAAALATQGLGPDAAREFLEGLRVSGAGGGMESVIRERLQDVTLTEDIKQLTHAVDLYSQQTGHEPGSLDDLLRQGILSSLPQEPFGSHYIYDPAAHEVRSASGRRALRLYDSERRQQVLSGGDYKD